MVRRGSPTAVPINVRDMSTFKFLIAGTAAVGVACGSSNNGNNGGNGADASQGSGGTDGGNTQQDGGSTQHDAPVQTAANAISLTSVTDMAGDDGFAYLAPVTIGGSQSFLLDLDTGSTTLGVAGSTCSKCGSGVTKYTPDGTATALGTTANAEYGAGSWTGANYSDSVSLMGDSHGATTMDFSVMTTQKGFLTGGGMDGIIGFGPSGAALTGTDSFVAKRPATTFAFQLCPNGGTLWLDGYDSSHTASAPQYAALTVGDTYYTMNVSGMSVNGTSVAITGAAVPDSGTTQIIASSTTGVSALQSAITGSSGYQSIFGSQDITGSLNAGSYTRAQIDAALPPLMVTLAAPGGGSVTIQSPATQSYLFLEGGAYTFSVAADSSLSSGTGGEVSIILGDAFLHEFVSIYDLANNQIGFAPQSGCDLPPVATPAKKTGAPNWWRNGHPTR